VKRKRKGLTIIEILTVVAIIAILVGLLLPATSMVRRLARETKQRAQFTAIGLGLEAFNNDFGKYPSSSMGVVPASHVQGGAYSGSQKLAEAMLGRDLLGYHPDSDLEPLPPEQLKVVDRNGTPLYPDPSSMDPLLFAGALKKRKESYVHMDTVSPFRVGRGAAPVIPNGLMVSTGPFMVDSYVLCDVFQRKVARVTPGNPLKAGTPILYFRADPRKKMNDAAYLDIDPDVQQNTYNYSDNEQFVSVFGDNMKSHQRSDIPESFYFGGAARFYEFIQDSRITGFPTAHRADSYILISAGMDGIHGTADDITNFERN